ncbi:MAG TPA: MXAN_5187 C-terminal domain-containing protein [Kofleriaceae bacterium]|nr:MXAN_5187 C-terminal domain-containing protein [Kofleriaceae bacterium]
MSRTVIAAVVAVVIAVLTAIAFFVTSASFEERARKDAKAALERSHPLIKQINVLEAIDVQNKAERLSAFPELVKAITSQNPSERTSQARIGFQRFTSNEKEGERRPDIIALVDKEGNVVAMHDAPSIVPKMWKNEKGQPILPAIASALARRNIISDVWHKDEKTLLKVGVATIIDPDKEVTAPDDPTAIVGAVVLAYAQTAKETKADKDLLGVELAYFDSNKVIVSSFERGGGEEDTSKANALSAALVGLNEQQGTKISVGGEDYFAAVAKLPKKATKELPGDYPPVTAGVAVLAPLTAAADAAGKVKLFILILGIGALGLSMLGLYLSNRRLIAQVDQVELGVTEIINGNLDRTFRPVGPELDGLSNALNVMLARLLGRPEPGEEEYDDEGNPIVPGRVEFEEGEERPAVDSDIAALAQEAEPDYYKRVYTEYVAARKASGTPDDVSFENFIAKLKVNEGKLKAQYQCKQVRFRVVTKDGKVSLKPVPIFA